MNSDLEALRESWIALRPLYADFADHVHTLVNRRAQQLGITCTVTFRAKEVHSLVKKAIRKEYDNPLVRMTDKAGVRAVTAYLDDVVALGDAFRLDFTVKKSEDKRRSLLPHELGYLGVHYDVALREDTVTATTERFRGLVCEIQLHTRAQNLWSDSDHDLVYKAPQALPLDLERRVMRLLALAELFDDEILAVRQALENQADYPQAMVISDLERHYYSLTAREFDGELSIAIIGRLLPLVESLSSRKGTYGLALQSFMEAHRTKVEDIFQRYADDDRCSPLLFQPEAILIFQLMEDAPFALRERWDQELEPELLSSLARVWGAAI
jgi:ppGpp synthetase/RelA/SpoT-type nucleotidyltranferase